MCVCAGEYHHDLKKFFPNYEQRLKQNASKY